MIQSKRYPKVSLITVVLNGEAHLEQTIRSVAAQKYPNIEYIIIDGGSTDRTLDIIEKYKSHIDYWLSEPDKGIYDAMNKGIKAASGEVIGILNSDDWYENDIIEWVVEIFEVSGADAVHGAMEIIQEDSKPMIKPAPQNLNGFAKGMLLNHPTIFAKKTLYDKYGLFDIDYKIASDWEMMLRWWLDDVKFYADDRVFSHFRMGGTSSTHLKKSFEEKHMIRKKHKLFKVLDAYYIYDRMKLLVPSETLLRISLRRQAGLV